MQTSPAEQIPVKINVKTTIRQANETETNSNPKTQTYELIAFGRYQQTASAGYLRYTEAMEVGNVETTVKITEKETIILRNGAVKMRMVFRPGHQVSGTYHTPHGLMEIITDTKTLQNSFNGKTNNGIVSLQYDLSMQGELAGTYHLKIKFKEERR